MPAPLTSSLDSFGIHCHPIAQVKKWRLREVYRFPGLPGRLLRHAAVWRGGAGFSFPHMPSLHFSYLRETWPNFPTVNICDVKPAESMSLSGLILAGFYEIAARSQSSAQIPSTWDLHYPGRLALSGIWGTDPQALYSRVGAETSGVGVAAENSGQNQRRTRNFQQCPLSKNHARNIPSLPVTAVSEQSIHSLLLMSSVSIRKKLPVPAGRSRVLGLNVPAWRSRPQSAMELGYGISSQSSPCGTTLSGHFHTLGKLSHHLFLHILPRPLCVPFIQ